MAQKVGEILAALWKVRPLLSPFGQQATEHAWFCLRCTATCERATNTTPCSSNCPFLMCMVPMLQLRLPFPSLLRKAFSRPAPLALPQVNVLDIEKTLGAVVDAVLQVRLLRWHMLCRGCGGQHTSAVQLGAQPPPSRPTPWAQHHVACPSTLPCLAYLSQEQGLPAVQREERAHALKKLGKVFQASGLPLPLAVWPGGCSARHPPPS